MITASLVNICRLTQLHDFVSWELSGSILSAAFKHTPQYCQPSPCTSQPRTRLPYSCESAPPAPRPTPPRPTRFSELRLSRFYTHTSSHSTYPCLSQFTFTRFTTWCSVDSPPRPRAADTAVLTLQHGTRPRGLGQNPAAPPPHSKLWLVLLGSVPEAHPAACPPRELLKHVTGFSHRALPWV